MDLNKVKKQLVPIFVGVSGALMGSTYGSGVGSSILEVLLALILIIFASIFSIERLFFRSREHFVVFLSGAIVGLTIEYFIDSTFVFIVGGVLAGICTLPLLSRIRAFLKYFVQNAPLIFYALVIIFVFAILTPIYYWALPRGILWETFIALVFFTSPIWLGAMLLRSRSL